MTSKYTGGCKCGNITYIFNGEPEWKVSCHCNWCQTTSGAAFRTFVLFNESDLEVSGDTLKSYEDKPKLELENPQSSWVNDFHQFAYSKSELEDWINISIQKSVDFFNNFTVSDTGSGAPNDIYVDIKVDKTYTMSELDEEWIEDNYFVTGFDTIEESSRTQIFD